MDLKSILPIGRGESKEHYWALVIEPGWVQAGVWKIEEEKADIVAISPITPWETDEELIDAADTVLSSAAQNLPEKIDDPVKTVFGLSSSWVDGGQIKNEHLGQIKRICTELSLEPAGFVVLPEAISNFYKAKEGVPISAVILGVGKENMEVAVFATGNLLGTTTVARSVSAPDDLLEGLMRLTSVETLPSRILLYDGKEGELEDIKQELINAKWEENDKVKFLHPPGVEIIDTENKVLACALAGASEIANITSIRVESDSRRFRTEEIPVSEDNANLAVPEKSVSAQELGFVVGEDINQEEKIDTDEAPTPVVHQPTTAENLKPEPVNPLAFLSEVKERVFAPRFTQEKKQQWWLPLTITLGILVIGIIAFLWLVPKAEVTVYLSPKKLEEKTTLSVDTKLSASDTAKAILSGRLLETSVSGEKTTETSGRKTVGEKAKGTVKVQNGTASNINLLAGTVLYSSGNLKFVTGSGASVSAALSPSSPGAASVDVVAYDIGTQYNLAKDEVFKVSNYPKSEVDATSIADFSGGSSREIPAVSLDDQKTLESDLTEELTTKATSELTGLLSSDELFINDSVVATPSSKSFSGKVGDEASNLKLSLNLSITGLAVKRLDLFNLAKTVLQNKAPSGFVLREDQLTADFKGLSSKNTNYDYDVSLKANLLPEVKVDDIKKKVSGKSTDQVKSYLSTLPGFSRVNITFTPRLPSFLKIMPRVTKHISIEVAAEQ